MPVYRRTDTKSKGWFYKFEIDGVTYKSAVPTARTRRQAEDAERRARQDVHEGRYEVRRRSMLFTDFLDEHYLPWAKLHRASNYAARVQVAGLLREHFAGLTLANVSQIAIERFKLEYAKTRTERGGPPKPGTVNHRLSILSAVLSHAVSLGLLRENPCRKVEMLEVPEEAVRYLTREEERVLMSRLLRDRRPFLYPFARVALGTGFRVNEVLSQTKASVDFARGLIFVENPKWRRDPRKLKGIPMGEEVRDILLRLSREARGAYLFTNDLTGGRLTRAVLAHALREACEDVGIYGVHPHSFRHTFGTRLAEAGVNVKVIQRLMGHADVTMTLKYIHAADETLRSAVECATKQSTENVPGRLREVV